MRSSPVTIRRVHIAVVSKFFPNVQINCHNGGTGFLPFHLWLLAAHPRAGASAVKMVGGPATPVLLRFVECQQPGTTDTDFAR